jgi:hypothetical protein
MAALAMLDEALGAGQVQPLDHRVGAGSSTTSGDSRLTVSASSPSQPSCDTERGGNGASALFWPLLRACVAASATAIVFATSVPTPAVLHSRCSASTSSVITVLSLNRLRRL